MKNYLPILFFIFVLSLKAQTYIGKNIGDIKNYHHRRGDSFIHQETDPKFKYTSMDYCSEQDSVCHMYIFDEKGICFEYMMTGNDLLKKRSILKSLQSKAVKISEDTWTQKEDGVSYSWKLSPLADGAYAFITVKIK